MRHRHGYKRGMADASTSRVRGRHLVLRQSGHREDPSPVGIRNTTCVLGEAEKPVHPWEREGSFIRSDNELAARARSRQARKGLTRSCANWVSHVTMCGDNDPRGAHIA